MKIDKLYPPWPKTEAMKQACEDLIKTSSEDALSMEEAFQLYYAEYQLKWLRRQISRIIKKSQKKREGIELIPF